MHYYPFTNGSCNTLNDPSNEILAPNKTKDLNLKVFIMITELNESKILTNHISCNLMVENVIQIKSVITINVNVISKIQNKIMC